MAQTIDEIAAAIDDQRKRWSQRRLDAAAQTALMHAVTLYDGGPSYGISEVVKTAEAFRTFLLSPRDPSAMKPKATDHAGEHVDSVDVQNEIASVLIGMDLHWTAAELAYAIYNGLRSRGMKVVRR